MRKFDEKALTRALDRLSPPSRMAFAASCAQRMVRVYHRYLAQADQYDRAADCDRALEYAWTHILVPAQGAIVKQLSTDVVALIPDQDAPGWTTLTAYGDDALSALAYCLRCVETGDSQDACWAARRIYEAVDCFATNRLGTSPNDSGFENRVLGDSLVQSELERQAQDIDELARRAGAITEHFLNDLRQRSVLRQALHID